MNDETILQLGEKAEQALQVLGEKLGQGAEYVWPVLIRQQTVEGVNDLIVALVFLISIFISWKISHYVSKVDHEAEKGYLYMGEWKVLIFISQFAMILFFIMGIIFLSCGMRQLLNPEYYALKEIFNLIN